MIRRISLTVIASLKRAPASRRQTSRRGCSEGAESADAEMTTLLRV